MAGPIRPIMRRRSGRVPDRSRRSRTRKRLNSRWSGPWKSAEPVLSRSRCAQTSVRSMVCRRVWEGRSTRRHRVRRRRGGRPRRRRRPGPRRPRTDAPTRRCRGGLDRVDRVPRRGAEPGAEGRRARYQICLEERGGVGDALAPQALGVGGRRECRCGDMGPADRLARVPARVQDRDVGREPEVGERVDHRRGAIDAGAAARSSSARRV